MWCWSSLPVCRDWPAGGCGGGGRPSRCPWAPWLRWPRWPRWHCRARLIITAMRWTARPIPAMGAPTLPRARSWTCPRARSALAGCAPAARSNAGATTTATRHRGGSSRSMSGSYTGRATGARWLMTRRFSAGAPFALGSTSGLSATTTTSGRTTRLRVTLWMCRWRSGSPAGCEPTARWFAGATTLARATPHRGPPARLGPAGRWRCPRGPLWRRTRAARLAGCAQTVSSCAGVPRAAGCGSSIASSGTNVSPRCLRGGASSTGRALFI